jgi:hypothetical protein
LGDIPYLYRRKYFQDIHLDQIGKKRESGGSLYRFEAYAPVPLALDGPFCFEELEIETGDYDRDVSFSYLSGFYSYIPAFT